MPMNNEKQYEPLTFDAIKIGLASPDKIMTGSATVENIKKFVTKAWYVTAVVWK